VIKCLTIVDDATHEAVTVEPSHAFSGKHQVRVLQTLCAIRGVPRVIRADNGKEVCGKDMLIWAHDEKVDLRLIEPGKPSPNAYIETLGGLTPSQYARQLTMKTATLAA